jgi:hypothetical protein
VEQKLGLRVEQKHEQEEVVEKEQEWGEEVELKLEHQIHLQLMVALNLGHHLFFFYYF